jgi:hypothetical protein
MSFAADIRHWPTLAAFEAHLAAYDPQIASWAVGVVYHHTWRPTAAQWRGQASMANLAQFYAAKGWDAGPHLLIVAGAPNPADDGIWQLTPLNLPGVHAGSANSWSWGLEIVGDYDAAPWPAEVAALALGAGAALLRWRSLSADAGTVRAHHEFSPKSCPGRAIDMAWVRAQLARQLATPLPPGAPAPRAYTELSGLAGSAALSAEQAAMAVIRRGSLYILYDLRTIATFYWRYAASVGLNADLAWAQAVHETSAQQPGGSWWPLSSWWAQRPRRNPAGLGVTGRTQPTKLASIGRVVDGVAIGTWAQRPDGRWAEGLSFPSWEYAVRAHLGRLLLYTQGISGTPDQQALARWAQACRPLPSELWGSVATLRALGAAHNPVNLGRARRDWAGWAVPGDDYGARIADTANALLGEARR